MSDLRRRLERLVSTDVVKKARRRAEIVEHARTCSDAELISILWGIPVERVPADLLTWPKEQQMECLERLRQEARA